jgi:hypothetical protein
MAVSMCSTSHIRLELANDLGCWAIGQMSEAVEADQKLTTVTDPWLGLVDLSFVPTHEEPQTERG